jgi:hypothetical protein
MKSKKETILKIEKMLAYKIDVYGKPSYSRKIPTIIPPLRILRSGPAQKMYWEVPIGKTKGKSGKKN